MLIVTCRICRKETTIGVDQDPICESCCRIGKSLQEILPLPAVERFCAHFTARETGWVEVVGEDSVKIANIPWCTGLNLDDVVTLKKPYKCCDRPVADKVVERKYRHKATVFYRREDDRKIFRKILEDAGAPCEGWVGPEGRHPGVMGVSYAANVDPQTMLEATGLEFQFNRVEMGRMRRELFRIP